MANVEPELTNPFRLIDLPTDATTLEIRRRLDELDVQIRLGLTSPEISSDDIHRIRPELEDPVKRFRAELRWLLWSNGQFTPSLSTEGQLDTLFSYLCDELENANDDDGPLIGHDLAVIATEQAVFDPANPEPVVKALRRWQTTNDSKLFRESMRQRALQRNDPRLTESAVDACLAQLQDYALERTLAAVRTQNFQTRQRVFAALRTADLHTRTLESAANLLFANEVTKLTVKTTEVSNLLENAPEPASLGTFKETLENARSILLDELIPTSEKLREAAPSLDLTTSADKIAALTAQLGEMYSYSPLGEFGVGVQLLRKAILNADRPSLQTKIGNDLKTLKRSFFAYQANNAKDRNDPITLIAAIELLSECSEEPERTTLQQVVSDLRRRHRSIQSRQIDAQKRTLLQTLESDPNAKPSGEQPIVSPRPHQAANDTNIHPRAPAPPPEHPSAQGSRPPKWVSTLVILTAIVTGLWHLSSQSSRETASPPTISTSLLQTLEAELPHQPTNQTNVLSNLSEYETGRDSYSDVSYNAGTLRMQILQPGLVYYLSPAPTGISNVYTLSASCQLIRGSNGGCSLIMIPAYQATGYQIDVTWQSDGMWAVTTRFSKNDSDYTYPIGRPRLISISGTRATLSIISTSSYLSFEVNEFTLYTSDIQTRSPGSVGFGAFLNEPVYSDSLLSSTITIAFDQFALRQDAPYE